MAADARTGRRARRLNLVWFGAGLAITAIYYVVPLGRLSPRGASAVIGFVVGLALVVRVVTRQAHAVRTTGAHVGALLAVLYVAVVFFAMTYYVVQLTWPSQFDNLATRTDALYFAVTVVTTVGFGDVHAVGQAARALVTVQMLFNVVVLGFAVTAARSERGNAGE